MPDLVLSVWAADDPNREDPSISLMERGADGSIASHPAGFDTTQIERDGAAVDLDSVLTPAGLMNKALIDFVGAELWKRLVPGIVGTKLLERMAAGDRCVYLNLRSPKLFAYPWEILRCEGHYVFASGHCAWAIGRPEPPVGAFVGHPPDMDHPLRIMVVVGNKPDDHRINADDELERIEWHAHRKNPDVLLKILSRPQPNEIDRALKDFAPHIFHFIGHGDIVQGEPVIRVWDQNAAQNEIWDAGRIGTVFGARPPRLVVLNACLTAAGSRPLAQAFSEAGCLSVLAMIGEIRGDASLTVSDRFYELLLEGRPVHYAASETRRYLEGGLVPATPGDAGIVNQQRSNWLLPRLLVQEEAEKIVRKKGATSLNLLSKDFVDRWDHRWDIWQTLRFRNSRLAVLCGGEEAGKTEILKTVAEMWARTGRRIIHVDVKGEPSGDWRDLLKRIAARAERSEGVTADGLGRIAESEGVSNRVIPEFVTALETCADDDFLLLLLDGLSGWNWTLNEPTVISELCAPYLEEVAGSKVRMMIALRDPPKLTALGATPDDWAPIEVGAFPSHEWERTVRQFELYWRSRIPDERQNEFDLFVEATRRLTKPKAGDLFILQGAARRLVPR